MPDLPTRADFFNIGATEVLARSAARPPGKRLTPEAVFTEGTDINIIEASTSAMADEATRRLAERVAALFLDSAEGADLDRLVADRFSPTVVRKQATPAVVTLSFSRPDASAGAGSIALGSKVRTETGVEYELTQSAAFGVSELGPITADAQATVPGTQTNAAADTITQFVDAPFDPDMVVTNPEPAAGGAEIESDASLRERARDFFTQARRGTKAAIKFGAETVAGVQSATVEEILDPLSGLQTGDVFVYIADAAGNGNPALSAAVEQALEEYRAAGIIVRVEPSVPLFVDIQYRLEFDPAFDSNAAFEQVRLLTVSRVNQLAPGQILRVSLLFETARQVPGVIVPDDAIVLPSTDFVPPSNQTIKTDAARVTLVT